MLGKVLHPEIEELIQARNFTALRDVLLELHPEDIGEVLQDLPPEDQGVIFRLLPQQIAAAVVEKMNTAAQRRLMHSLGHKDAAAILNTMTPDDRTALLEDLPGTLKNQLLGVLSPEEYRVASQLLAYPNDSVGRRMIWADRTSRWGCSRWSAGAPAGSVRCSWARCSLPPRWDTMNGKLPRPSCWRSLFHW